MIVFDNANSLQINEGEGEIIIEIDPTASNITEVTEVEISTIDGNARSTDFTNSGEGLDFTALDNFVLELDPDNSNTFTFAINITDDAIAERAENFQFRVRAIDDPTLNGTGRVTILDDDNTESSGLELEVELAPEAEDTVEELLPAISINDVEQLEGNSGITDFEFTLSLSEPSQQRVTVDYATADGTAEAIDYIADSGTIIFEPGETEQTIIVEVVADTEFLVAETESETFFINLSNQTNASLNDVRGIGTIINDDFSEEVENSSLPIVQLNSATFVEGNTAENTQQLIVNLVDRDGEAVLATEDISFTYRTVDINAAANLDYQFIAAQTGTIESGESDTTIDVTIIGDEEIESEEFFAVVLTDLDPELAQFDNAESRLETVIGILDDDGIGETETETEETEEDADEEEISSDDTEEDVEEEEINNDDMEEDAEETESEDLDLEQAENDDEAQSESALESESDVNEEVESSEVVDSANNSSDNSSDVVSDGINNDVGVDNEIDSSDIADNTVLRFLNTNTGGYLYTASEAEQESLESSQSDFQFETASFTGVDRSAENAEEVYRFLNTSTGGYFYTASETERDFITNNLDEFVFEDVAFSAYETNVENSIPVYRFLNANTGIHFYTANEIERVVVDNSLPDYNFEGIAFYALPVSEMI